MADVFVKNGDKGSNFLHLMDATVFVVEERAKCRDDGLIVFFLPIIEIFQKAIIRLIGDVNGGVGLCILLSFH